MINNIVIALRWSLSIGNKIFKVVPGATLLVVLATLISQFSVVMASLLPLKIIMLLGSNRVPGYFPGFFSSIDREVLIVSLSVLAVCFYFSHILAEKLIAYGADKGGNVLLSKSQKMALFENQKEIASQGFHRFSRALASVVLLLLISVGLCWLYLDLFLVLLVYSLCCFFLLVLLYSFGEGVKKSLDEAPGQIIGTATGVGFLLAFGFMVVDFLWRNPPGILVAVVSLILMRQGFSRISGLVGDLRGLYVQRLKLNALFFHGHVFVGEAKKHETNFWSFLQSPQREQWILDVLNDVCDEPIETIKTRWFHLGISDVALFQVESFSRKGERCGTYLLKLFSINKASLARHEASLLAGENSLPFLRLESVEVVQGLHCHVMNISGAERVGQGVFSETQGRIYLSLIETEPDRVLASRFNRSHPPLWQRISDILIGRLKIVADMLDVDDIEAVDRFSTLRPKIVEKLRELPLCIVNPDIGPNSVLENVEGNLVAIHWGRWSLEPVGAGWPVSSKQLDRLSDVLEEAGTKRKTLRKVDANDVRLAALVFELEKMCARQQFESAIRMLPQIVSCIDAETSPEVV